MTRVGCVGWLKLTSGMLKGSPYLVGRTPSGLNEETKSYGKQEKPRAKRDSSNRDQELEVRGMSDANPASLKRS